MTLTVLNVLTQNNNLFISDEIVTLSRFLLLLPGAELPLVESFGLLNDLFPLPSILDAGYPISDFHLANVLFDVILPSVLGSSL